jgi:GT2 family glycosyltransferase
VRVAVLTLCRDRLEYTKHCFASLRENAGCEYDHYVLDQGSQDGTGLWLRSEEAGVEAIVSLSENVGISRGLNRLLDLAHDYDVIVKYDNDCELLAPDALRDIAALTLESGWILGPVMHGYGTKLVELGEFFIRGHTLAEKLQIQGCFLAATGEFYKGFRYNESNPTWGMDDAEVCARIRRDGGHCGQVLGYEANHYETTLGQEERYPEYFAQKVAEGLPWP